MCVCVSTPAWLHLLDISIFAISTHSVPTHVYSLQHPLLLMRSLSVFATCHPKKGCHWQSVFCRYKDRPPKGNCNSTRYWGYTRVPNEPCCCLLGKEKFYKRPRPDSRTKGTGLLLLRQMRHPTRPGQWLPKIIEFIILTYKFKTCCQQTAEHTRGDQHVPRLDL